MMIPFELLSSVAQKLSDFRGNGSGDILFSTTDRGNYGGYHWDETAALLKKADPTGFSLGLLLHEMIEATVDGSKVQLSRVLREPGFVEKLHDITRIKAELDAVLEAPRATFHRRITKLLANVSPEFGEPTSREIALAMRDAVYCIEKGMSIKWVQCEPGIEIGVMTLRPQVVKQPDLAGFIHELKYNLPYGTHLAKIGHSDTAIGIKEPGVIVYMSSMKVNLATGKMQEYRSSNHHLNEKLDLDFVGQRYPEWHRTNVDQGFGSHRTQVEAQIDQVSDISRDSIIWLAMMMELAKREMSKTDRGAIRLTESARMALSHESVEANTLPVPYKPSWTLAMPDLAEMLASLNLSEWELKFTADGLEGVDPKDFLPIGDSNVGLTLDTKQIVELKTRGHFPTFQEEELRKRSVRLISVSEGIAGTQEEMESAIRKIYQVNLANYLISYGNRKMLQLWNADMAWFKEKLTANALNAMDAQCSHVKLTDFERWHAPVVAKQSAKHKGFKALCFVKGKGDCDVKAHVFPQTDSDLAGVLGLNSVGELPEYLQGWSRELGWTTGKGVTQLNPAITDSRWYFSVDDDGYSEDPESCYEGFIYFNSANHPTGANKPRY